MTYNRKEKRICYSRVKLPSGEVLRREVVVFGEDGRPVGHFPLDGELPFVEWRDETYIYQ